MLRIRRDPEVWMKLIDFLAGKGHIKDYYLFRSVLMDSSERVADHYLTQLKQTDTTNNSTTNNAGRVQKFLLNRRVFTEALPYIERVSNPLIVSQMRTIIENFDAVIAESSIKKTRFSW
jgi:hypothetical protein